VAMTREVAASLRPSRGWELEVGQLCEVFRHVDPREICQVEGAADYDHKHQPAAPALAAMAGEIAGELFAQLAVEGVGPAIHSTLLMAYQQEAAHALRRSAALSLINGLAFDADGEAEIVATFTRSLTAKTAGSTTT
jgi:glucosyl-3-phosphoglycerate synthase